ncbi:MAG TPA: AAA family ATPase [Acholeplasmataceae bacterium]|nr:AAA family ATPase [Acholeplasmataceae bacterium]
MKIKQINFTNHVLFGNTSIDFTDESGKVLNTILICGENGSGKTKLLECLYNLFKIPPQNYEVVLILENDDLIKIRNNILLSNNKDYQNQIIDNINDEILVKKASDGNYWTIDFNNGLKQSYGFGWDPNSNNHPLQFYLCNIVFKIKKNDKEPNIQTVSTVTKLTLDEKEVDSNSQYFAGDLNITQLLVDLQAQDADEFLNNSEGKTLITEIKYGERVKRLKEAFNKFFSGSIRLDKVRNFDINFENNGGKNFDITGLSSGEKSIIQYGGFFLKNQKLDEIMISFLDEPEQSLHPLWEEKILSFYQDVLTLDNKQKSQLFCITHSEHVVKNALQIGCLILIMNRKSDGSFGIKKTSQMSTFPFSPTYSEIKYNAFNLTTNEFHEELYGYLAERERCGVRDLDAFFMNNHCLRKPWIGKKISESGSVVHHARNDTFSLCSYIRNYTHHPELRDADNPSYSPCELRKSIEYMLSLL